MNIGLPLFLFHLRLSFLQDKRPRREVGVLIGPFSYFSFYARSEDSSRFRCVGSGDLFSLLFRFV